MRNNNQPRNNNGTFTYKDNSAPSGGLARPIPMQRAVTDEMRKDPLAGFHPRQRADLPRRKAQHDPEARDLFYWQYRHGAEKFIKDAMPQPASDAAVNEELERLKGDSAFGWGALMGGVRKNRKTMRAYDEHLRNIAKMRATHAAHIEAQDRAYAKIYEVIPDQGKSRSWDDDFHREHPHATAVFESAYEDVNHPYGKEHLIQKIEEAAGKIHLIQNGQPVSETEQELRETIRVQYGHIFSRGRTHPGLIKEAISAQAKSCRYFPDHSESTVGSVHCLGCGVFMEAAHQERIARAESRRYNVRQKKFV